MTDPWWVLPLIVLMVIGFFTGIGLAVYTDDPVWLVLSVFLFCIMYAG